MYKGQNENIYISKIKKGGDRMKGDIPLGVMADVSEILPGATFTRGARKTVNNAVRAGVETNLIAMDLVYAGITAQTEGRSKIGPIGGQRVVFERINHRTNLALARRAAGTGRGRGRG